MVLSAVFQGINTLSNQYTLIIIKRYNYQVSEFYHYLNYLNTETKAYLLFFRSGFFYLVKDKSKPKKALLNIYNACILFCAYYLV